MPAHTAPSRRSYPSRRRKATMIPTTRAASTPSRRVTMKASNMGRHLPARLSRVGRGGRLRAAVAQAGDLQRVARRDEAVGAADLPLQRRDPQADELHHPAAAGAHQVVVLLAEVHVLVEETPAAQPLLARQAALHQQVEVTVDGRPGDLQAAGLHRRQQLFGVDVPMLGEDLLEQRQPLAGDPLSPAPQVLEELLFLASVRHGSLVPSSLLRFRLNSLRYSGPIWSGLSTQLLKARRPASPPAFYPAL